MVIRLGRLEGTAAVSQPASDFCGTGFFRGMVSSGIGLMCVFLCKRTYRFVAFSLVLCVPGFRLLS